MPDAKDITVDQKPLADLPEKEWDVLVVGAGPAGSIAAIHLASKGHDVLLLDRERFPRDKVCGDALIADAIRCLHRVDLYDAVQRKSHRIEKGVVYSPPRIEIRIEGEFLTLRRGQLDEMLAVRAGERGAEFAHGTAEALCEEEGTVACTAKGTARTLRARFAVIATGVNLHLLKALGMVRRPEASAFAVRCYIRSSTGPTEIIVSYDRSIIPGYGWIFPMGEEEYNVGCGVFFRGNRPSRWRYREMFEKFVKEFPPARRLLETGKRLSPLRGHFLRCSLRGTHPLGGTRILAAGESIGTTFPFTGEGIGKAMESGEIAAALIHEALEAGDPGVLREFPERLEKELEPRYLGYRIAEEWLSKAWLNDFVARRATKSEYIRSALEGVLTETRDPREIFSLRGILKSFWG